MEIYSPQVLVRETGTAKGRGVFATRAYAPGETIEICPAVLLQGGFSHIPSEVRQLLYHWSSAANGGNTHCLALGYGSLYNHANPSNMRYEAVVEAKGLRFTAATPIAVGEELTANYDAMGGGNWSEEDGWFRRMGVTPFQPEAERE